MPAEGLPRSSDAAVLDYLQELLGDKQNQSVACSSQEPESCDKEKAGKGQCEVRRAFEKNDIDNNKSQVAADANVHNQSNHLASEHRLNSHQADQALKGAQISQVKLLPEVLHCENLRENAPLSFRTTTTKTLEADGGRPKGELKSALKDELKVEQRQKLQHLLDAGLSATSTLPEVKQALSPKGVMSPKQVLSPESPRASPVKPDKDLAQNKLPPPLQDSAKTASTKPVEISHNSKEGSGEKHHLDGRQGRVWHANGYPLWAQERFEVLLFNVAGLSLAVPLISLGQIQAINQGVSPIFGQTGWFMGFLNSATAKVRVVNTALFVMPEKYREEFLQEAKYVVTLNGSNWGLTVDRVDQPITLDPSEVKWRINREKRPWLAGTVKSAMCALMDVSCLLEVLTGHENQLGSK